MVNSARRGSGLVPASFQSSSANPRSPPWTCAPYTLHKHTHIHTTQTVRREAVLDLMRVTGGQRGQKARRSSFWQGSAPGVALAQFPPVDVLPASVLPHPFRPIIDNFTPYVGLDRRYGLIVAASHCNQYPHQSHQSHSVLRRV